MAIPIPRPAPLPPPAALHDGWSARAALGDAEWQQWVRVVERKRRLYLRVRQQQPKLPAWFVRDATRTSFAIERITLSSQDLGDLPVAPHVDGRQTLRSRQWQRVRNHFAIFHAIDRLVRRREMIKVDQVLRWYTSISSGLSTTMLAGPKLLRLESVIQRINAPQLRVQPAVMEIARLYNEIVADPLVPSFSGILARLLLQVHLGHCGLPPVTLGPLTDVSGGESPAADAALSPNVLLRLMDQSFDRLGGT